MSLQDNSNNDGCGVGIAGHTDYRKWENVTTDLITSVEEEELAEKKASAKALGLDGKYAHSQAEAQEREKLRHARETKRTLDRYQKRQGRPMQCLPELLGPFHEGQEEGASSSSLEPKIVRVTRDMVDAGKRVLTISDTSGRSPKDTIVLSQDLNHLESAIPVNATQPPKSYPDDAENEVPEQTTTKKEHKQEMRTVHGLIKLFLSKLRNCTVIVKCKLISGTVELSHCDNVVLRIEKEATVATLQVDICQDLVVEFRDAPSGKNANLPGQRPRLYWGDDKDDRIFHAGVSNMRIALLRDGFVETETIVDYRKDGAMAVGNASAQEYQFVTSVMDGEFITEKVVRSGATTGKSARAMTERELQKEKERREKATDMAIAKAIQFREKEGGKSSNAAVEQEKTATLLAKDTEEIEEVYASMTKSEIEAIVAECEDNKARGNEAFGAGEYAQAVLLYSLSLDKADELPDVDRKEVKNQLFPRHIVLSNRSACFLKLGEHEKALKDATKAQEMDPTYVKAVFRRGLALHALGRYSEALPVLASAIKMEPKNKQIQQAIQFCEVRLEQERRKRMEG